MIRKFLRTAGLALGVAVLLRPFGAEALEVFACEPEWAALATELGGDKVEVFSATTARQDPHQIQARPALIARLRSADLVICTGAELEIGWMPVLLRQAANARVQPGTPGYMEASQYVRLLEVPTRLDRAEGDIHPAGNPHIQSDPRNIAAVATALARRLSEIDPADNAVFAQVRDHLLTFQVFETGGSDLALAAAENYRALRRRGHTVRKTIDCLIATFCLEAGHTLLHRDRDFDPFEKVLGMSVVQTQ